MAIGKRIKYIRSLRGLTQKELGEALGFKGKTSDVRVAQYESETRVPKDDMLSMIADTLHVHPKALSVPDIDTYTGLIHTLFALEDIYGVKISANGSSYSISFDASISTQQGLYDALEAWHKQSVQLENGKISKQEYDEWRYNYPHSEADRIKKQLKDKNEN